MAVLLSAAYPSTLRARENESPWPRRPSQSLHRRDHSLSEAKRAQLSHSTKCGPDRPDKENAEQQLPGASSTCF